MARKKHITWENTYPRPYVKDPDGYSSYVWTKDNRMVLTFDKDVKLGEYNRVVDTLNGEDNFKYEHLKYNDGNFFDGDKYVFCIRGWGHLTSTLRLSPEKACKIQDAFSEFILEILT